MKIAQIKDINFRLDEYVSLEQLQLNRDIYKNVKWLGAHNKRTRVWEMEDSHLLNVIKNVGNSINTSKLFPLIEDFKRYDDISYHNWAQFLYNEFLFREAALEKQYENHLEEEIFRQNKFNNDYYGSYGEFGDYF